MLTVSYLILQACILFLRCFRQEWRISVFALCAFKKPLLMCSAQDCDLARSWVRTAERGVEFKGGSRHDRNRHNRHSRQNRQNRQNRHSCLLVLYFAGQAKREQGALQNRQNRQNRHEGSNPPPPLNSTPFFRHPDWDPEPFQKPKPSEWKSPGSQWKSPGPQEAQNLSEKVEKGSRPHNNPFWFSII